MTIWKTIIIKGIITIDGDHSVEGYWGPAPVGSRDSLGRTTLAKRIAKQRDQRLDITGLRGKLIKFVTPNLLPPRRPQVLSQIAEGAPP